MQSLVWLEVWTLHCLRLVPCLTGLPTGTVLALVVGLASVGGVLGLTQSSVDVCLIMLIVLRGTLVQV